MDNNNTLYWPSNSAQQYLRRIIESNKPICLEMSCFARHDDIFDALRDAKYREGFEYQILLQLSCYYKILKVEEYQEYLENVWDIVSDDFIDCTLIKCQKGKNLNRYINPTLKLAIAPSECS